MARETKELILNDRGQDKRFKITEMPATKWEKWLYKAIILLAQSGIEFKDKTDLVQAAKKLDSSAITKMSAFSFAEAEPLLDELLKCCTYLPEGAAGVPLNPNVVDGIVESASTLMKLRVEAFTFNISFLELGGLLPSPEISNPQAATTYNMRTSEPIVP